MQMIGNLGARLLEAFVPKTEAQAYTCHIDFVRCECRYGYLVYELECLHCSNGYKVCGPCRYKADKNC